MFVKICAYSIIGFDIEDFLQNISNKINSDYSIKCNFNSGYADKTFCAIYFLSFIIWLNMRFGYFSSSFILP